MQLMISWNQLNDEQLEEIRKKTGANLLISHSKEEAMELIPQAEVALGFVPPEVLVYGSSLKWLQLPYAGVERVLSEPWGNKDMIVTNGSGIFGPCIAEQVIGMLLSFTRGLHYARDYQKEERWQWDYPFGELTGRTVGLLGFGDIGTQVAKRLVNFDTKLIGIRQNPRGDEPYVERMVSISQLDEILPELDFLVCSLPHTDQTVGLLDARRISRLPKHAVIINVGRGSLIVEADLAEAIQSGDLLGAGLDVTSEEPLSTDSPLWGLKNVIITPHNSGMTPHHIPRALDIFFHNWQAFCQGGPMRNVVNPKAGY